MISTSLSPHCPVVGAGHGVAEFTILGGPYQEKMEEPGNLGDGGGRLKSRERGLGGSGAAGSQYQTLASILTRDV